MSDDHITTSIDNESSIGRIRLSREPVNAMNKEFTEQLVDAIRDIRFREEVNVIVIESSIDGMFSAGGDFNEFMENIERGTKEKISEKTILSREAREMLENTPKPVIALIDGHCLAGGLELALACDFRYATPRSTFGLTENDIGAVPGGGGTQRLPRVVGRETALKMILFAERIPAEEATETGLVTEVFEEESFDEKTEKRITELSTGAAMAHGFSKLAVKNGMEMSLEEGLSYEWLLNRATLQSRDFDEAMEAFREDRDPEFEGA